MILAPEDVQDCTRIYYRGFVVTANGLLYAMNAMSLVGYI